VRLDETLRKDSNEKGRLTERPFDSALHLLSEAEKAEQCEHENHDENDPENRHSSSFSSLELKLPASTLANHSWDTEEAAGRDDPCKRFVKHVY